jgi:hypothetical protein
MHCCRNKWLGISVQVKCTLVQALRLCTGHTAHREKTGIDLPFLDHCTRRRWGVGARPRPLFASGKDPLPIVREAGISVNTLNVLDFKLSPCSVCCMLYVVTTQYGGRGRGPPCWVVTPFYYLLCNRTHPYPVTLLPIGSVYFRAMDTPTILKFSHFTSTCLWRWNKVFRNVGIKIQTPRNYPEANIQNVKSSIGEHSLSFIPHNTFQKTLNWFP